jgi:AcrR family transcriptional regulator
LYDIQTNFATLGNESCRLSKARRNATSLPRREQPQGSRLRTAVSPTPRHSARATRAAGQSMRSRLLDAASALFKARGLNGTSITAIANASDAFPSQITYYFRSKEALFVEAACRDILHIAERAEKAAARARTPKAYARALTDSVTGADGLVLFVEALILTRQRPDLVPEIARTIERLHVEGARAYAREMARHRWRTHHAPDIAARRFWTIALGIALEGHATGRSVAAMSQAMREALGELAQAPSAEPAVASTLHLVAGSGRPSKDAT